MEHTGTDGQNRGGILTNGVFRNRSQRQKAGITVLLSLTLYILFVVLRVFSDNTSTGMEMSSISVLQSLDSFVPRRVITQDFPGGRATLTLELLLDGNNTIAPGKQYASVSIHHACLSPSFSVGLTGEALVSITFVEASDHQQSLWLGEFIIQLREHTLLT